MENALRRNTLGEHGVGVVKIISPSTYRQIDKLIYTAPIHSKESLRTFA